MSNYPKYKIIVFTIYSNTVVLLEKRKWYLGWRVVSSRKPDGISYISVVNKYKEGYNIISVMMNDGAGLKILYL